MSKKWYVLAPLAIAAVALFAAIGGGLVMLLWNWLLPPLFGWRAIGFWQALGLLALARILFGGCGLRGSARGGGRGRLGERIAGRVSDRVAERVVERLGERWEAMAPDDRERFRQRVRERFGLGSAPGESGGR